MNKHETIEGYFKFLRIVIKYALFALLAFLVRAFIMLGGRELAGEGAYSALTLEWMALVVVFLAYFTLARSFTLHDMTYREQFFEGDQSRLSFARKAKFVFSTPRLWIDLLITYALMAIMPYRFGFLSLINVLSFYNTVRLSQAKLYIALIAFPILLLISVLATFQPLTGGFSDIKGIKRRSSRKRKEADFLKRLP